MTVKDNKLRPYYAAGINHNVLDNKKVLQIMNSCLGECYSKNDSKVAQLNHLGNGAFILIGLNEQVNMYSLFLFYFSYNLLTTF
jgi:hypothetical protein